MIKLNDEAFYEKAVVHSKKQPVLIYFYAAATGEDKEFENLLNAVSSKYKNEILVFKVDIQESPNIVQYIAQFYQPESLPFNVIIKKGEIISAFPSTDAATLNKIINKIITPEEEFIIKDTIEKGNPKKALKLIDDEINKNPDKYKNYVFKALAYLKLNDSDNAAAALDEAVNKGAPPSETDKIYSAVKLMTVNSNPAVSGEVKKAISSGDFISALSALFILFEKDKKNNELKEIILSVIDVLDDAEAKRAFRTRLMTLLF